MTLRTYLRLLHPLSSGFVVAIYTVMASGSSQVFFHLDPRTAAFLAVAAALPLLLGFVLAGAVHEPMHRSFILLLPGQTRILRRATALAVLVLACFVTAAATLADPAVSPVASFGLATALLALPSLDRHRTLLGSGGMLGAFVAWIGFNYLAGHLVRPAMVAAPWAFGLGGLAVAAAALARGFARAHLRERTETFFAPVINSFAHLFDRRTATRQAQALLLARERRSTQALRPGRDWTIPSVGASTRDWMRVVWHAFSGRQGRDTFGKFQLKLIATAFAYALCFPLFFFVITRLTGARPSLATYWDALASFTALEPPPGVRGLLGPMQACGPLFQPGFAALIGVFVVRPQWAYPVSRDRLARVVFALTATQFAFALAFPALIILLSSLAGQLASGHLQPAYGLRTVVAIDLMLLVYLPLMACASIFRSTFARLAWAVPVGIGMAVASLLRVQWIDAALAPAGLAVTLLASAAAAALLWFGLRHHYRANDLIFERTTLATQMQ